ncbi:Saccharopine dehydrogenase [Musa troglodytarum]|uniref:Saccharopine dehydrogenase n=1 Tax=Musa troglodytarum TaxID=320322 RepID=A0A9E7JE66_9LILI|nr:Saccharopine dehydrogenase [Musa troglodytarum]
MARAALHISMAISPTKCGGNGDKSAENSRVLILGGTGRVGGSTATALSKLCPSLQLLIAGRNREKGAALVSKLGKNAEFVEVNIESTNMLEKTLEDVDLVVHAAGPFQKAENCSVLEAAISTKTAYVDICDDTDYSQKAKSFHSEAVAAGVPAITTGGIYPGVSNVMAAELVHSAKSENAGSGGAGPTILATSFLLLGEDVIAYNKGEMIKVKPYSGVLNIDFGKGIGKRDVYLLNLPEVRSTYEILGVPNVSARFGTAPFFWNWGMQAIANFVPMEILRDRSKVQQLVQIFNPLVRAIDGIAGERVAIRVDLECSNGRSTVGLFTHKKLSVSVGYSIAAFALAVLEGSTQHGVWFPEEPEGIAIDARKVLLERAVAAEGTINFVMNKPPWLVETDPKEIGLGIYRRGTALLRDGGLLQVLRSEINHELSSSCESSCGDGVGSEVEGFMLEWTEVRTQDVVLRRQPDHIFCEEIAVSALLAPLQFQDKDPLPRDVLMKVCIKKAGYDSVLRFDCRAFCCDKDQLLPWTTMETNDGGIGSDFTIRKAYCSSSVDYLGKCKSVGPIFSSLDPQLQKALKDYLVVRGITPKLTNFLLEHLHRKEHSQYVNWLRTMEGIVAK